LPDPLGIARQRRYNWRCLVGRAGRCWCLLYPLTYTIQIATHCQIVNAEQARRLQFLYLASLEAGSKSLNDGITHLRCCYSGVTFGLQKIRSTNAVGENFFNSRLNSRGIITHIKRIAQRHR